MVDIELQRAQNVEMSDCWSLGSNRHSSGRARKISIGITVEKHSRMGSDTRKEDGAASPYLRRAPLSKEKAIEHKRPHVRETVGGKHTDQKAKGWFSPGSMCHEAPSTNTFQFCAKRLPNVQPEDGVLKQSETVVNRKGRESGQTARVEEAAVAKMKEIHGVNKAGGFKKPEEESFRETVVYSKRRGSGQTARVEEPAVAKMKEVHVDEAIKCNTEALKSKLWEILGSVPSQNKQTTNSPTVDVPTKIPNPTDKYPTGDMEKAKQNSDTIEADTESPIEATRRPVTRSVTHKKSAPRTGPKLPHAFNHGKKSLPSSSSGTKLKFDQRNIFAFDECQLKAGSSKCNIKGQSSGSSRKRNLLNKPAIEPFKKGVPQSSAQEKHFQNDGKEHMMASAETRSPQNKSAGVSSCVPCQSKNHVCTHEVQIGNQNMQTSNEVPKGSWTSPIAAVNISSPPLAKTKEIHDNSDNPCLKMKNPSEDLKNLSELRDDYMQKRARSPSCSRSIDPLDDLRSPTLVMKGMLHLPRQMADENLFIPVPPHQKIFGKRLFGSRSLSGSGSGSHGADVHTESLDDSGENSRLRSMNVEDVVEEKETVKQLSLSPTEEQGAWSFDTEIFKKEGFRQIDETLWNANSQRRSPFSLRCTKRVHGLEDAKLGITEPSSPHPSGSSSTQQTTVSHEASEQYPEDCLERATVQLALVLEKFKKKIQSHASKKCSKILAVAADKLQTQLQDVECQIQADLGKFTGASKLKRKHLEAQFDEQKERLKCIHEKFKEDVNRHLLDCRNALKELEEHQMELKGTAERENASHKKLLVQVEEDMMLQLQGAETSISAAHKEAKKKMEGLKYVLREFLKDDMIS